jgi:hypothetical protein
LNTEYYPEAYTFQMFGVTSTFFNLSDIHDRPIYNDRKDSSTTRRWLADFGTLPPQRIAPFFEVTDTNWGAERIFRCGLELETGFRILDLQCTSERPELRYVTWDTRSWDLIIIKDTRINLQPGAFSFKVDPLYYDQYNP